MPVAKIESRNINEPGGGAGGGQTPAQVLAIVQANATYDADISVGNAVEDVEPTTAQMAAVGVPALANHIRVTKRLSNGLVEHWSRRSGALLKIRVENTAGADPSTFDEDITRSNPLPNVAPDAGELLAVGITGTPDTNVRLTVRLSNGNTEHWSYESGAEVLEHTDINTSGRRTIAARQSADFVVPLTSFDGVVYPVSGDALADPGELMITGPSGYGADEDGHRFVVKNDLFDAALSGAFTSTKAGRITMPQGIDGVSGPQDLLLDSAGAQVEFIWSFENLTWYAEISAGDLVSFIQPLFTFASNDFFIGPIQIASVSGGSGVYTSAEYEFRFYEFDAAGNTDPDPNTFRTITVSTTGTSLADMQSKLTADCTFTDSATVGGVTNVNAISNGNGAAGNFGDFSLDAAAFNLGGDVDIIFRVTDNGGQQGEVTG